jgi:SAM-dependent methyltransferase
VSHDPHDYRAIWNRKPVLRAVYQDIYRRILDECVAGPTLEIGGGSGNFKSFAPDTISSEVVAVPWVDVACDAQRLPFADGSFANLVMVDVMHHIENPLLAFREAARVLRPGGRMVMCEPAITPLSSVFYRLFHEEPVDMSADPLKETGISADRSPWDSNQAIPTLLVTKYRPTLSQLVPNLRLARIELFSFFAYPLSGGFKPWSMLPSALAPALLQFEWSIRKWLGPLAAFRLIASYSR